MFTKLLLNKDSWETRIDGNSSNNQTKEIPMNTKLNVRQWALASLVVFIIITAFTYLMIRLGVEPWVMPSPQGQDVAQPDAMSARIATYLSRLILSGLFTYIFSKTSYEGKSVIGHGVRYGLGMGLLMFVPNFVSRLVYSDLSTAAQATYMVVGVIQSVVCGAAMAQVYKAGKPKAE